MPLWTDPTDADDDPVALDAASLYWAFCLLVALMFWFLLGAGVYWISTHIVI